MGYLCDRTQQNLAWLATAAAATMLTTGAALVMTNPQLQRATVTEAYRAGRLRQEYRAPQAMTGRVAGYLLAALGLPVGAVGAMLADKQPRSLTPTPTPHPDDQGRLVITGDDLQAELQTRIADLLYANDWLRACLKSNAVIICGDMGSGKTTIAAAIALLRELLWGWETATLDPHADDNLETWLNGRVFGSEKLASKEPDYQIADAWGQYRQRSQAHRSIVLDEFSSWGAGGDKTVLGNLTADVLKHGTADARKFMHHVIYLVHGEENGMLGGTYINSGWQVKLKTKAVGIRLVADYDDWGEPKFTGKAEFKAAGKEWKDSNFQPFAIPGLLKPGALKAQLGTALEWLEIGIDPDPCGEQLLDPKLKQAIEAELTQSFDDPALIQRLENIAQGPVIGHPIDGTAASEPMVDWQVVKGRPDAVGLVAYLKRKKIAEVDPRKLQQNWGCHQGLNADEIQDLLDLLTQIGAGHWLTDDSAQQKIWELRISPDRLPDL
jgi:hypothetical protein